MKPYFFAITLLLLSGAIFSPVGTNAQNRPPQVGKIKDTSLVYACGYYFQFPKEAKASSGSYIFMGNTGEALMNLDGRDIVFKPVKISQWRDTKIGAKRQLEYRAGQTRIRVETKVVKVGNENDYEPSVYDVNITIQKGRAKGMVKAVGYSGC